ncbi:hypothetical protein ATANTOWER_026621 [Ataeniobius toweri]|uniref:Uncharacterized protein n=1 Tax=Ataeniobius toweri TaxID=208326 RepID=A0ABU7BAE3_9TELE|nr:hypothetical protein [Ataeniobius toweri]
MDGGRENVCVFHREQEKSRGRITSEVGHREAEGVALSSRRAVWWRTECSLYGALEFLSKCDAESSAGGETTIPGLDAVSQKLPVILFTLLSCHHLLNCLLIFLYIT